MKKTNKNPSISVVLPAYNAGKYISVAIQSILDQSFVDFELIIINDCSTDNTYKIIKEYEKKDKRIIIINNKINIKLARSLNKGIKIAKGKYIARMDADDWSYPNRLMKQYNFMETHPDVGIVGGKMEVCDEELSVLNFRSYKNSDKEIRKKLFFYSPFSHPLIMIRTSILKIVGIYNNKYNPAEDYELYFRIGIVSKFANIGDILLKYRTLSNSMTGKGSRKMELMTLSIRKKYFKLYKASCVARIYYLFEKISLYIIPMKLKIFLFNYFRSIMS